MGRNPNFSLEDCAAPLGSSGVLVDFNRHDDFGTVAAGTAVDGGGAGIFTAIASGTLKRPTQRSGGGWARLAGADTSDNSGANFQLRDFISLDTVGKTISFKARFIINEVTSTNAASASVWTIGLAPMDTAINHATSGAVDLADGFYFHKAGDATAIVSAMVVGSSTTGTTATLTAVEAKTVTQVGIGIEITSISSTTPTGNVVFYYQSGTAAAEVFRLTGATLPATTVFFAPSVNFQTTDNTGAPKFMDLDYIGAWQSRVNNA